MSKRTWVIRLIIVYDELVGTRYRHFACHVHNIVTFSQDDQLSQVAVDICWKIFCRLQIISLFKLYLLEHNRTSVDLIGQYYKDIDTILKVEKEALRDAFQKLNAENTADQLSFRRTL